ncbi:MAG TPA: alkyl sulfatase C-terminal domain-containing protein [Candidatus Accumulibacter phosphatis]|jgi:alkyl sulfatase BDS1-like metallo-beta-lactamase superfamily hydrolase|nr:MAG: hypothetical protein AW07_00736 [Candidatus Accumulibacter sp. SK-11]HAY28063.1 hypothetical protein [Accumulibacter sp.]HCN69878.1 hypothetical protein [Accumulibacter sp.]HRL74408.1 alkyl sulfatase C-terminal domain-containing protein [Candidatus Accumulibacter phosphatis]HRQ95179.1 alkyl sulfatase C-terminal domain-containing protein [Candidatus Accumulibacter phosphatis]
MGRGDAPGTPVARGGHESLFDSAVGELSQARLAGAGITLLIRIMFTLLRYRINPQGAYGKTVSVGYRFNDPYEDFALILRDGILEAIPRRTKPVEARVEMTRKQFDAIFAGSLSHERAASLGACITGAGRAIATLFAVFDRPDEQPVPNTALR